MVQQTQNYVQARFARSFRVIFALIMRDMATTYGKSTFGYLWAVFEPIAAIALLSLVFSVALNSPALGDSFPLFYATGYIPFMLYNTMQNRITVCLRENLQLLFYPRVTYIDAFVARGLLTFFTQLVVAIIVFWGIVLLDGVQQRFDLLAVFVALAIAGFLGLGIGVLNSVLIYLWPSWRLIWSVVTRPLFLVSCIFYLFDVMPNWVQAVLWYNPLVHLVGYTRSGFYSIYAAEYVFLAFPMAVSGFTLFLGLVLLRSYAKDMING